jgi:hypothetical protein
VPGLAGLGGRGRVVSGARSIDGGPSRIPWPRRTQPVQPRLAEIVEYSRIEWSEAYDLGDQVLCIGRLWVRFASGVELDQESACLFTWRNRKCLEARVWMSHAEALEAAGLSE